MGAAASVGVAGLAGCAAPSGADSAAPLAPTPLDGAASAQFRGGLQRWGLQDVPVPADVTVDWTLEAVNTGTHTAAKASPVSAPTDDVIIAGDTGTVRAVRPDGSVRWTAETEPTTRGIHGTPAIANGTVYVGAYDGAVYAFDLRTGDRMWRSKLGDAIGSSPAYYNGLLYIAVEYATPSGRVYALDAADGKPVWVDRRPTDHPHSSIAIDREAGRLVVGANDGNCYAWTFPGLEREWVFETGGPIKGPIATVDSLAIVGSWDEHVYALDLATGDEVWSFRADGDVMAAPAIDPTGVVYVGSHDWRVYALDLATGEERWRFATDGMVIGGLVVTPGHVLVGSYDATLYALDKAEGTETWAVTSNGHVTSAPLVRDDGIYYTERAAPTEPGHAYKLVPAE